MTELLIALTYVVQALGVLGIVVGFALLALTAQEGRQ